MDYTPRVFELRYVDYANWIITLKVKIIPSFGRSGRPRKIILSDLFLWDPMIELDLGGISMSQAIGETSPGLLSLVRDMGRKRKISIKRVHNELPTALEEIGSPLADEFRKALNGGESRITELGSWCCFIYSQAMKSDGQWPPKLSPLGQHLVDIEQALKEPTLAWQQNDMTRCADLLEATPVLSGYLWPEVISKLRNALIEEEILEARCMVMLEIYLSFLACCDAQLQINGFADSPSLGDLFPNFMAPIIQQPNALYFSWLSSYSGTKSKLASWILQVSKAASDLDIESTKRQLRRWKSGKGFPSIEMLDALFRKLYGDKARDQGNPKNPNWELSWSMAMGTRRINFLMTILVPLSGCREPAFPWGYETIQDWRESRYQHWYHYWLPLLMKQQ